MRREIFGALVDSLASEEPVILGRRRAAVAVVLSEKASPKLLLIRRSKRSGDPWSGQVAFPGGKFQEGDASMRDTAVRETLEETGVDLAASSDFLGYAGKFGTHTGEMEVVTAVFLLKEEVQVKTNEEAESHMWAGLSEMLSPGARSTYEVRREEGAQRVPAFRVGDYVVWGLTRRIILALVGEDSA